MGSKFVEIKLHTAYNEDELKKAISQKLKIKNFNYFYDLKSLDLRQKKNIHWQIRLLVESDDLKENAELKPELILPDFKKRNKSIAVIGNGPAGFFAAEILNKAGYQVTVFERGTNVEQRAIEIREFEKTNKFSETGNYVFGEGGAGTFSDGKLTSRTKGVSALKNYILKRYVESGAPAEIAYLSKPHIGSNVLRNVVKNLRIDFETAGGKILFNNVVKGIKFKGKTILLNSSSGDYEFDIVVFACGHSSYDTFRMLISEGVKINPKPFALGVRVEHPQELINLAVWGKTQIEGLKAAEYVLKWNAENNRTAYSFCMCPGGKVVQSAPHEGFSVVNGMSNYLRNSQFANSAIVVPFRPEEKFKKSVSASFMIDYIENLEANFWNLNNSFAVPANNIEDFLRNKVTANLMQNSYSHGVFSYDFRNLFDTEISSQLNDAMKFFSTKLYGFEKGIMLGLESKTSSSVQIERDIENLNCVGHNNLYAIGEGSGYAGGIVSSAVDGIKVAMQIVKNHQ